MHTLVAATGGALARFDVLARATGEADAFRELTNRDAHVRVGVAGQHVVDGHMQDGRAAAVLGSAVYAASPGVAVRVLERAAHAPLAMLDGIGDDAVGILGDEAAGTLTVAAGAGNHRLFIAEVDGGLLVCSQLRPLAVALGRDLALERGYEDFLLGFGFLPDGLTVYAGVRALGAGEVRVLPDGDRGRVTAPPVAIDFDTSDREIVRKALHDAFFSALEAQAGDRRRHAVLLGGFDSALVASGLRRLGHDVDCYTFGFGDDTYEQRDAAATAAAIGAPHAWVRFTPEVVGGLLAHFDEIVNQPGAQPHYQLHTVYASTVIANDGHTNIFNGDGCDAAFLGYPTVNQRARLVARFGSVPAPVRHSALRVLGYRPVEQRLGHIARLGRSFLGTFDLPEYAQGHLPTRYLDDVALQHVRTTGAPQATEPVNATRIRLAEAVRGLDRTRLAFHGNGLTGQSKAKVEGAVAVSGLPQFSPFLDPQVKALGAALPTEMLRPPGSNTRAAGKAVLVDMVREHSLLPESVIALPKQSPSDSPIDGWYAGPLRPVVYEMLDGLPFTYDRAYVDEILAPKWVEERFRERVSLAHHTFQAIGLLCSYAAFTRRAG